MIYKNENSFSYLVHLCRIGSCKTTNHSTTVIKGQVTSVAKRMQLRVRVDKRSLLSMRPSGKSWRYGRGRVVPVVLDIGTWWINNINWQDIWLVRQAGYLNWTGRLIIFIRPRRTPRDPENRVFLVDHPSSTRSAQPSLTIDFPWKWTVTTLFPTQ